MIRPYRGLVNEALTENAQVLSGTVVDDLGGGGTVTTVYGGTIPCRVDALGGSEAEVAGRISDRSTHLITLRPQTQITSSDGLLIGAHRYEVTAVREYTNEFTRAVEAVRT